MGVPFTVMMSFSSYQPILMSVIHATDDDAMFFIDPDECIDCGACEPECPVTAIFAEDAVPEQWTNFVQINADYFVNK